MKSKVRWLSVVLALAMGCLWAMPQVAHANHPPVLYPISDCIVDEGQPVAFGLFATDTDGDALTYTASNLPAGATFDATSATFSWTPNQGQAGVYQIVFSVTDDGTPALSDSWPVTITVTVHGMQAAKGVLQFSEESGWSLQTKDGELALPPDELDQYVEGLKARVRLKAATGELERYRILYRGAGVDLKLNGQVFDLASKKVAAIPYVVIGLRVYNKTCQPVAYCFSTLQRYDFEITDSSGAPWSDGRAFLQVLGEETLVCKTNPALQYYAKFPLFDSDGFPTLQPGVYKVRGWLTNDRILDQANVRYGPSSGSQNIFYYSPMGQEFKPTLPLLAAVGVEVSNGADDPLPLIINVREDHISGPVVGSEVVVVPDGNNGWVRFDFSPPLPVTPGRTYVIELVATQSAFSWSHLSKYEPHDGSVGDTYPDGRAIVSGKPQERKDWCFKTYTPGTNSMEATATFHVN